MLPKGISKVGVPPIKCQGIKTKLVPFIMSNIKWNESGRWIEPFVGSGVVLFNVMPKRALVSDTNIHIINLYKAIQAGEINGIIAREYFEYEGNLLLQHGQEHYYEVRQRFNEKHASLDFLFLSRACFNGVMRFNKKGGYNVPFCHKPDRFRQAYVTKIVNQIEWISRVMEGKEWTFEACDWEHTLSRCKEGDFVYLDPPYIGRHTDYFNSWDDASAEKLATIARNLPCGFALSMWKENQYRRNTHLDECWGGFVERQFTHFYHVGSTEGLRNSMEEVLIITPRYAADLTTPEKMERQTL